MEGGRSSRRTLLVLENRCITILEHKKSIMIIGNWVLLSTIGVVDQSKTGSKLSFLLV